MKKSVWTREELHRLLQAAGHAFWTPEPEECPIDVIATPETIVTVGVDADGALQPAYRQRYFACLKDGEEVPLIRDDPEFAFREPFVTFAAHEPWMLDFVDGPVRWLFTRLRCFAAIVVWPRGGFRGPDGLEFLGVAGGKRVNEMPYLEAWLSRHEVVRSAAAAIGLDLSEASDCQVLWEAANYVGQAANDFFLCDETGREVYCLHHHDKIMVSIPDRDVREALVEELRGLADVFEDCSGYRSTADEDFGW